MKLRHLLAALAVVLVSGCGTPAVPEVSLPQIVESSPEVVDLPAAIRIPKFNAASDLLYLGLNPDGSLEVPPVEHPELAGWYAGKNIDEDGDETKPGQRGSAVIAAHVDGLSPEGEKGYPGLFFKLGSLEEGDQVLIDQRGGTTLTFVVESVERFSKAAFPGERVYKADDAVRLNLVTCGGAFDSAAGHYEDNIVVFTKLA